MQPTVGTVERPAYVRQHMIGRINMGVVSISEAVSHLLEATTPDGPELDSAIEGLVPVVPLCGDPDALEGIRTAATELRLRNTQRQQRETQLQGLLHTAQRLLNVSAVDQLLQVILTATQDLLGCDVAHLNLRERNEAGFETLRACEGALTEAFRRQQTAPGSGITGRVTTTKSAYVTDHYLTDSLINHDPTGDAAVAGEDLRTLAGVPLFSGEEVIGVLVASFRVPTTVSSDQLGVLAALGSLTALSVSSARLHEEKEDALHGLESVNAIVQGTNELLEWSASAHDRLTTLALEGADLSQIVAAVHELVGGLAAAADTNGTVMTSYPQTDQLTIPSEAAESVAQPR
jgi:GAF domain-containing protein